MLPLDNIKVLDMTARAPGPFCSMVLSDLGAEVLVVETPPEFESVTAVESADRERGVSHDPLRRNKRSIILNLKHPEALAILHRLASESDVVMEGNRPGVAQRLHADYDTLKKINPAVVYCSISGYGQTGDYRLLPGHDINYISFGGALGVIGNADGAPAIPFNLIADYAAGGLVSAVSILSALWVRERTGQGQFIDMSMTDGALYLMAPVLAGYFASGTIPGPSAMRLNGANPDYQAYKCSDGRYVSIGCLEKKFWVNLCTQLDRKDLIGRQTDEAAIQELQRVFETKTRDEWFEMLCDKEIAIGKVLSADELADNPQIKDRRMLIDVPEKEGGFVRQVGIASRLEGTPGKVRFAGAKPGAHTDEVVHGLGYDDNDILRLREEKAIG